MNRCHICGTEIINNKCSCNGINPYEEENQEQERQYQEWCETENILQDAMNGRR